MCFSPANLFLSVWFFDPSRVLMWVKENFSSSTHLTSPQYNPKFKKYWIFPCLFSYSDYLEEFQLKKKMWCPSFGCILSTNVAWLLINSAVATTVTDLTSFFPDNVLDQPQEIWEPAFTFRNDAYGFWSKVFRGSFTCSWVTRIYNSYWMHILTCAIIVFWC